MQFISGLTSLSIQFGFQVKRIVMSWIASFLGQTVTVVLVTLFIKRVFSGLCGICWLDEKTWVVENEAPTFLQLRLTSTGTAVWKTCQGNRVQENWCFLREWEWEGVEGRGWGLPVISCDIITIHRDVDRLKTLWKRLKSESKKKDAISKRELRKTGGGSTQNPTTLSPKAEWVIGLFPKD